MILRLLRIARSLLLLGLLALPSLAFAQYMYIDANGDGVHTAADVMAANGTPKTMDVWLIKTYDRDGSLAVCNTSDGDLAYMYSYAVHVNVLGGTAAFSNFVNAVSNFTIACAGSSGNITAFNATNTEMSACEAGVSPNLDYTPVKLFTVTVTGLSGSPSLQIVRLNSLDLNFTAFGTNCSGNDFDNTYKLGTDWFDADGVGSACFGCSSAPFLNAVTDMTAYEGTTATQTLTAVDPDGSPVTFQKVSGPLFMTVTTNSPTTGAINLTPGYSDGYSLTPASVRCTDGANLSQTRSFYITVVNVNRYPVINIGGPYTGVPNVPIPFDGTASYDPDGDPLTFFWTFGDNSSANGPAPAHGYAAAGVYIVSLNLTDGLGYVSAGTTATITDVLAARAFTTKANRLLRLGSGKPYWTIQIEPVGSSFDLGQVGLETIKMKSPGTGTVSEVGMVVGKSTLVGDADGNGVPDLSATFAKRDLEALFSNLNGSTAVPVALEGGVTTGGIFRAQASIGIIAGGGSTVAVLPNPLRRVGEVWYSVSRAGRVRVEMFDVSGRLVRTIDDRVVSETGLQSSVIDARSRNGAPLASGIYYVRVSTDDVVQTQRVAILK